MDIFEKLNKAFTGWYESLFGDAVSDIRPKDVLRKIVNAMEDNRKEGLDNRIYVPNKYILEISFASDEEREYLLAFLEKEELETALRKYMSQNKYYIRGPLDFTIEEVAPVEGEEQREKLRVKCKWEVGPLEVEPEPAPQAQSRSPYVIPELADHGASSQSYDEEEYTVAATDIYDVGTVAPPMLRIKRPDGTSEQFLLTKPLTIIGRSQRLKNDLVIDNDGMISKRHAKISMGADGFSIADLDSTNGTWVNDEKVSTSPLRSGDVIRLGATELVFEEAGVPAPVRATRLQSDAPKPRLMIDRGGGRSDEFRLPSETVIGRALTSDVRFEHHTVSQRHAKVFSSDGRDFYIEDLGSSAGTRVNGIEVFRDSPVKLKNGDTIQVGEVTLRYAMD